MGRCPGSDFGKTGTDPAAHDIQSSRVDSFGCCARVSTRGTVNRLARTSQAENRSALIRNQNQSSKSVCTIPQESHKPAWSNAHKEDEPTVVSSDANVHCLPHKWDVKLFRASLRVLDFPRCSRLKPDAPAKEIPKTLACAPGLDAGTLSVTSCFLLFKRDARNSNFGTSDFEFGSDQEARTEFTFSPAQGA